MRAGVKALPQTRHQAWCGPAPSPSPAAQHFSSLNVTGQHPAPVHRTLHDTVHTAWHFTLPLMVQHAASWAKLWVGCNSSSGLACKNRNNQHHEGCHGGVEFVIQANEEVCVLSKVIAKKIVQHLINGKISAMHACRMRWTEYYRHLLSSCQHTAHTDHIFI